MTQPFQVRQGIGAAAVLAVGLGLSACGVVGDSHQVSVEHPTNQPLIGQLAAERHCARYGKTARHLQTSPPKMSVLVLDSRVSQYECVSP